MTLDLAEYYVNVTDVARLHAIALLAPNVKEERIYAFAGRITLTKVIKILRELRPDNQQIPDPPPDEGQDLSEIVLAPKAEKMLRAYFDQIGWISLKESIATGI